MTLTKCHVMIFFRTSTEKLDCSGMQDDP